MNATINHRITRSHTHPADLRVISATSLSVDAEVRGIERPRVPNYALRRAVVGTAAALAACVLSVGMLGVVAGLGGEPATAAAAPTAGADDAPAFHVAETGDTMWSIAQTHRGSVDHGRYLDALVRRNGGTGVQQGQAVWLP